MAVPNGIKIPAAFEYVFPAGAFLLGVEPVTDFDRKAAGAGDDQARDKDTGEPLWQISVIDSDDEASKFGRSPVVKVKIAAPYQPVPPSPQVPGYPPRVAFEGLTLTPYVDQGKCKATGKGTHRCGARQAYSIRAAAMVDPAAIQPDQASSPA